MEALLAEEAEEKRKKDKQRERRARKKEKNRAEKAGEEKQADDSMPEPVPEEEEEESSAKQAAVPSHLQIWLHKLHNLQKRAIFSAKFWRARSRLYRNRFLQVNYKICIWQHFSGSTRSAHFCTAPNSAI